MKTRTVITLAAIAGGFYMLNELRKKTEAAAGAMAKSPVNGLADDVLGPSPQDGQWITKGDLRGILPRQYHDFEPGMGGWGSRLRSAVSHAAAPVRTVIAKAAPVVKQVAKVAAAPVVAAQVAVAKQIIRKVMPGQKAPAQSELAPGEVIQYVDSDGRPITKEEFDRLNAAAAAAASAAKYPQAKPAPPTPIVAQSGGSAYSSSDWQSADSSDYNSLPPTSSVSASSSGSPGLPTSVTSVQTPSADMAPSSDGGAPAPASSPLVPAVIGGGILAAILAFGK